MPDRLQFPPERDFSFYQRRKHDTWREVPPPNPPLEALVADSHAHIHMLPDPAWELACCAANGVDFTCMVVDPSEDGPAPFDDLDLWVKQARELLDERLAEDGAASGGRIATTEARIATGVHPHNARHYDAGVEAELLDRLDDPRVVALGEVGLDFHYDLSAREAQREVFRRQVDMAKQANLPVVLHLRGGEDPQLDNAHREALDILREVGFPQAGTLLHCCSLPPDELRPWVEAGCHIAYGGALTFKKADAAREGARLVPPDRLLLETDSPYMTPEPMRGAACTPAHVIFTAAALAEARGAAPGIDRQRLLEQIHVNTLSFFQAT